MTAVNKLIGIAALTFLVPVGIATFSNWSNIEPFVIGSPDTSRGTLLYFSRKG